MNFDQCYFNLKSENCDSWICLFRLINVLWNSILENYVLKNLNPSQVSYMKPQDRAWPFDGLSCGLAHFKLQLAISLAERNLRPEVCVPSRTEFNWGWMHLASWSWGRKPFTPKICVLKICVLRPENFLGVNGALDPPLSTQWTFKPWISK